MIVQTKPSQSSGFWSRLRRFVPFGRAGLEDQLDAPCPFRPTHRHAKGGLYRVIGEGIWEADRTEAVIYQDSDGTIWVRPRAEFEDGRFSKVD